MCLLPRQRLESSQLTLGSHIFNFPVANCYHLALLHKGKKVIFYLGKHFTIYGVIELAILLMELSWYKILCPIPHKINWTRGGQKVAHGAYELFRFRHFNSLVLSYQSLMTSIYVCPDLLWLTTIWATEESDLVLYFRWLPMIHVCDSVHSYRGKLFILEIKYKSTSKYMS